MRIERFVHADVLVERSVGQVKLFWHDEYVAQHLHTALTGVCPVERDGATLRSQQTTYEVEQRALARPVFAQQSVDAAFSEAHAKLRIQEMLPLVAEVNVLNVYHNPMF